MTSNPWDAPSGPGPDETAATAAFQRFYFEDASKAAPKSWWYRAFVGWWRDRS